MSPCTKRANTGKRCEDGNRRSHDNSRSWTKFFSCARKNAIRWLANIYGKHETTRLPCSSNHTHIAQKQFCLLLQPLLLLMPYNPFDSMLLPFGSPRIFDFSIFRFVCFVYCAMLRCSVLFCSVCRRRGEIKIGMNWLLGSQSTEQSMSAKLCCTMFTFTKSKHTIPTTAVDGNRTAFGTRTRCEQAIEWWAKANDFRSTKIKQAFNAFFSQNLIYVLLTLDVSEEKLLQFCSLLWQ